MEIKKFNIKSEKHSADAIKGQKLESIMQTKDFQSVFSTFYNAIKKTLVKMSQLRKQTGFLQMKNIDLCQALKGTVFKTQLNQLCDIKQIISSVEIGFASLQCYDCDQQAAFVCEGHQEAPFKLFCEDHFEEIGLYSKSSINLTHDLKLNVMMLNELERHLVSLQEKIEYFSIKKDKKNPVLFQKFKGLIDDNFKILNTLLKNMATKSSLISQKGIKTIKSENKSSYENLSFIKDNCDKCRNTIFQILSMIPEVCEKMEADSFVQVIVDSDKGVPLEEERKESLVTSVPDHIYGKEYKLVHIPTQSFVQFKEFEKKIKANCEAIETCIEDIKKLKDTADMLNKMLEDKLAEEQKENVKKKVYKKEEIKKDRKVDTKKNCKDDSKNVLKQLSLRDDQFYIEELKLDTIKAKEFKKEFTISSGVYKRLGQFNYGQPSCTTDYIRTCIKEEDDENYGWIYIGEVKEGADDTPHGIGIKVMNGGTIIQEGNWNDGKLHGKGRHILSSGNYYIGEYKGGNYNGEGAYYCNGDKYEGGWKDGNYYGQGTYYKDNGDKYIGQWDGDKGQGEINYTDGKKYIGHWDGDYSYDVYGAYISDYLRHGFGTLYSQKGQVLKEGKWHYDEYKGKE